MSTLKRQVQGPLGLNQEDKVPLANEIYETIKITNERLAQLVKQRLLSYGKSLFWMRLHESFADPKLDI